MQVGTCKVSWVFPERGDRGRIWAYHVGGAVGGIDIERTQRGKGRRGEGKGREGGGEERGGKTEEAGDREAET